MQSQNLTVKQITADQGQQHEVTQINTTKMTQENQTSTSPTSQAQTEQKLSMYEPTCDQSGHNQVLNKVIKIPGVPSSTCFRCDSPDHFTNKCPEKNESYNNYQVNGIINKQVEEAQARADKSVLSKRKRKRAENNKDYDLYE